MSKETIAPVKKEVATPKKEKVEKVVVKGKKHRTSDGFMA